MSGTGLNEELGKRIRTLTSLLSRFKVQKSPSGQPKDVLPFLSHFTTLLTCGDKDDRQAKKVIAVTGYINAANEVRTLVASQNPYLGSTVKDISLQLVKKSKRSLEDVVKGLPNAPLVDHVADIWAALSALTQVPRGPDYSDTLEALELFFLSRSYRKFVARFKEGTRLCGKRRLYEVIAEWQPDSDEITPKWVRVPTWLVKFEGLPPIKSRVIRGKVEWEFSDDTKKAWSKILEILLFKVDEAIERARMVGAKSEYSKKAEEERQAMVTVNMWSHALCYFVIWEAGIVRSLLTETNMVASITTTFMPTRSSDSAVDETDDDDGAQFLREPNESKGHQVYRYLKTVVAWHSAIFHFSQDTRLRSLLESVEIGLVEVPPSPSSVLTLPQISEVFFTRFPDMMNVREQVLEVLGGGHSDTFSGCTHAEATLMGLVNYYTHETKYAGSGPAVMNAPHARKIIQPVADSGSAVVAASKKCCWCCHWLGQNLEMQFKLPGTHGIMYPWDPPTVGISESVLQQLEKTLWEELYRVVLNVVTPAHSRQSSATGSPSGMADDDMDEMNIKYEFRA